MKKPEILAPAGNLEKLKTAINFGADAVYIGGNKLNLRAFADNFDDDDLKKGIDYAHKRGKKVYVTLNVFPHNEDLIELDDYLIKLRDMSADALIVSDPGIIMTAREIVPDMELHLSTQANNVNYKSALFWHKQGIKRIVLARELTFEEISFIHEKLPNTCELEIFVHGSMCMSYSGRCLLSNYLTGRDSNRGQCAQPCRYKYYLMEEKRPGEYYNIVEDDKGTYIMNSKDLCMIKYIPELVKTGARSLKIEGRMKSAFYVASVVKAYRQALDAYFENPDKYEFKEEWMDMLMKPSHREYFTGFYFNEPVKQVYNSSSYIRNYDIIGVVRDYDAKNKRALIEQRNKAYNGDKVEVLKPKGKNLIINLNDMKDINGNKIESAPCAQMLFTIETDEVLEKDSIIIKAKNEGDVKK